MKKMICVLLLIFLCLSVSQIGLASSVEPEEYSCFTVQGYTDMDGAFHNDAVLCIYKDDTRGLPIPNNNNVKVYYNGKEQDLSTQSCDYNTTDIWANATCYVSDGLRDYFDLDHPLSQTSDGWFYYGIDTSWLLKHWFWDDDTLWKVVKN